MMIVITTIDNIQNAEKIAHILIEEKLAVCINIIPNIRSIYIWQGEKKIEEEVIMVIKTEKDMFPNVIKRLKELHPYDLPEIIGLPINYGLPEYLEWIKVSLI